jgi:leucyl-tRNA---protein transferase
MTVLQQFYMGPEPCVYLPDEVSLLEYDYVSEMTASDLEIRLNAGWRKFGRLLFHPICDSCQECRPVRINVADFVASRSQERCLRQNVDLDVRVSAPKVDDERLDLYHRYHLVQEIRKGWPETERTSEEYAFSFTQNLTPAMEITVRKDKRLLAVVLMDITPNLLSGTYHYHDPEHSERGLGKFGMLQALGLARRLQKPWAHFGYYVKECSSLNYKTQFRPCEILGTDGVWRPLEK